MLSKATLQSMHPHRDLGVLQKPRLPTGPFRFGPPLQAVIHLWFPPSTLGLLLACALPERQICKPSAQSTRKIFKPYQSAHRYVFENAASAHH